MTYIHPTAIIDSSVSLGSDVEIGPYVVIKNDTVIGNGTKIDAHCIIGPWVTIGSKCEIYGGASIGAPPQDIRYKGERSYIIIGNNNIIREYVTIHRATGKDKATIIGDDNFIMAYSHIAHNCKIGNGVTMANSTNLAGYVEVFDRAVIGGIVGVHQFVRIGRLAMVGACSKVVQDVLPFSIVDGHPAMAYGINIVGLRRAGYSPELRSIIQKAFRTFYFSNPSRVKSLAIIEEEFVDIPEIEEMISFIKNSRRGIVKASKEALQWDVQTFLENM